MVESSGGTSSGYYGNDPVRYSNENIATLLVSVPHSSEILRQYSYKAIDYPYDTWITDEIVGLTTEDGKRKLNGGTTTRGGYSNGSSGGRGGSVYSNDNTTSFYTFTTLPPTRCNLLSKLYF